MRTKLIILFTLIFVFQINATFAQGCEDTPPPTKKTKKADSDEVTYPTVTVFGYFQPQYNYYSGDIEDENTFNFKRARFGIRGRVSEDFSYYVMVETSDFISSDGDVYLMDAFITYDKYDWLKASLGSFKQPFGLEVTTACHGLTTINRSIVADQLVAPQRDYGLMLLGKDPSKKFSYSLALMNGRGLGTKDNNEKKDFIGRLTYKFFDFVEVGGSFRYGYPNNQDDDRTTFGGDVVVTYKGLKVQSEYIHDEGDYNRAAGGGCGSTPVELGEKRQGAYVMASYDVNEKFQPVFKYEYFDADTDIKKLGYQEMMTIGINYFFNKSTRLQINYQDNIEGGSYDNALLMQMQVKF
ncbi:porin [Lutibacter sp. B1]|uniref:porin n=1 Tax=Lutibacter sp. B1 TaxID=2725996 RepID=UPI001456D0E7|nr:porin [Lutibacter sp. B1]NLP58220.1 outer membrane beta-barrel protein [Lutibacter sp. B1]